MTPAQIARIETELGVALPDHYRAVLLDYPDVLRCTVFAYSGEPASESFLFDDPARVIAENAALRDPDLLILDGETRPWPARYFAVGKDGGGNYWCVKLGPRGGRAVWVFDHDAGAFARHAETLADHVAYAVRFVKKFNRTP